MAHDKLQNFWTQTAASVADPKRGFRFKVSLGSLHMLWYAKKADRPTMSLTESKHEYLNHTFYWPGRVEWNEVSITLVDPTVPDVADSLLSFIKASGYKVIGDPNGALTSISKGQAAGALGGDIQIEMIDELGVTKEQWVLRNAWIKEVDFSELSYDSDDLSEITVKVRYDWAEFTGASGTKFSKNS